MELSIEKLKNQFPSDILTYFSFDKNDAESSSETYPQIYYYIHTICVVCR